MKSHAIAAAVAGALIYPCRIYHPERYDYGQPTRDLVSTIKQEEDYKSTPYPDTVGNITIGYGTNLSIGISKDEADFLLKHRMDLNGKELEKKWPPFKMQPEAVQSVLVDMSYNLGVHGLLKFHKMLDAMQNGDYDTAADEIDSSKWAAEVPSRAKRASAILRKQEG